MSAVEVLENLIKLGTVISDAAANNKKDGKFDFVAFLQRDDAGTLKDAVTKLVTELKPDELAAAVDAVEKKQKDLLAGKQLTEISMDKLVQYSALTDTKLLLNTARMKRAVEGDFFAWLLDDGLSGIMKVFKVALPLLV